eukprot:gene17767-17984_t
MALNAKAQQNNDANNQYYIDRRTSGKVDFNPDFAKIAYAPRLATPTVSNLELLVDASAIDLFADNGLTVMASVFFPNQPYSHLEILHRPDGGITNRNIQPFVTFSPEQLQNMLQPLGGVVPGTTEKLTLTGGETAIVFIEVESDRKKSFPARLIHRVVTDKDSLDGAIVSTAHVRLQSLVPPLHGANWIAADGPGNDAENHHRRGVVVLGGHAVDSRRYAIDWKKVKDSVSFSGNPRNVHSYFCYAENVFAVADGRVIRAKDGLPDNVPGHGEAFHPAVPLNFETIAGNSITIDLGNGHYAYYMHLQPGSLLVKAGDRVHRGQLLARIGASGDAREPHLHFEITTSPELLFGEGIPYSITRYRLNAQKYQDYHIWDVEVPGSSPGYATFYGNIAQWLEQHPYTVPVIGSSPVISTYYIRLPEC